MRMQTTTYPKPIGPYLDYTAVMDYINEEIRVVTVLCTRKVLAGQMDDANYWAKKFAPLADAKNRLNDWFDANKNEPSRWIGWDVQKGYEVTDTH